MWKYNDCGKIKRLGDREISKKAKARRKKRKSRRTPPLAAPSPAADRDLVLAYADRQAVLAELGFRSYHAYLKSDLWQRIRRRLLKQFPDCYLCGGKAAAVHHRSYDLNTMKGRKTKTLRTLCNSCHRGIEFENGAKVSMSVAEKRLLRERTRLARAAAGEEANALAETGKRRRRARRMGETVEGLDAAGEAIREWLAGRKD